MGVKLVPHVFFRLHWRQIIRLITHVPMILCMLLHISHGVQQELTKMGFIWGTLGRMKRTGDSVLMSPVVPFLQDVIVGSVCCDGCQVSTLFSASLLSLFPTLGIVAPEVAVLPIDLPGLCAVLYACFFAILCFLIRTWKDWDIQNQLFTNSSCGDVKMIWVAKTRPNWAR